jgi:hypothetical protein
MGFRALPIQHATEIAKIVRVQLSGLDGQDDLTCLAVANVEVDGRLRGTR